MARVHRGKVMCHVCTEGRSCEGVPSASPGERPQEKVGSRLATVNLDF